MIITQFGAGSSQVYTFPLKGELEASDNFRDVNATPRNVIGASGGIDQFGYGMAPTRIGEVRVSYWIKNITSQWDMEAKLQDVGKMLSYGLKPLYRTAWNGQRQWCWARLDNAPIVHTYRNFPEKRMRIQLTFTVPDPRWFARGMYNASWGDGVARWGDGVSMWGGLFVQGGITGESTSDTITYNGNTPIQVNFLWTQSAANACTGLKVARIVGGNEVEWVRYTGTIAANATLYIAPDRRGVYYNWQGALSNLQSLTPDWLTLMPGSNTFRISREQTSGFSSYRFTYLEAYR